MLTADDLPWPELGNVSRGATRGNQGQKGTIGPPDSEGRCVLQLRVQPGVLAVRLNRKSSEWYRILEADVNRALKLTKTYWRKARRRQDYDARADQDHMELHEWLQQLKDKVMSHLEMLMQRGDIQGPPYAMPDNVEFPFLRKYIERHNAGIPHNPRLRDLPPEERHNIVDELGKSDTPPSESRDESEGNGSVAGWDPVAENDGRHRERLDSSSSLSLRSPGPSRELSSVAATDLDLLTQKLEKSKRALGVSRDALTAARKKTLEAHSAYNACLQAERIAEMEMITAEERRDNLVSAIIRQSQNSIPSSSSMSGPPHFSSEIPPNASESPATSNRTLSQQPDRDMGPHPPHTPHTPNTPKLPGPGDLRNSMTWENALLENHMHRSYPVSHMVPNGNNDLRRAMEYSQHAGPNGELNSGAMHLAGMRNEDLMGLGDPHVAKNVMQNGMIMDMSSNRKHSRDWSHTQDAHLHEDDMSILPPRKRVSHPDTSHMSGMAMPLSAIPLPSEIDTQRWHVVPDQSDRR